MLSQNKTFLSKLTNGQQCLFVFLTSLLVAASFFIPAMIMDGGVFTFYGDYNAQQIPFYFEAHKNVTSGQIFWGWTWDLGSNFIGSNAYYMLGSPFFWVTLLFPNSFIPTLLPILLCFKFALSALTAYLYIRLFTKTSEYAVIGAFLYAFSSHAVYSIFFNQFNETFAFFPLMLYGLEVLIQKKKRFVLLFATTLCALANYYLFVAELVFLLIYFLIRLFTNSWKDITLMSLVDIAIEELFGVGLAAFMLMPAFLTVSAVPRSSWKIGGWGMLLYDKVHMYPTLFASFFQPPDLPARPMFFPDIVTKWSSVACWLPMFGTIGVFAWIRRRKKDWLAKLIILLVFFSVIPVLNSSFQLFSSSYYTRWFYMLALILSLTTAVALERCKDAELKRGFIITAFFTILFSVPMGLIFKKAPDGQGYSFLVKSKGFLKGTLEFIEKYSIVDHVEKYWVYVAVIVLSLLMAYIILFNVKRSHERFFVLAMTYLCIIITIYANIYIFFGKSYEWKNDLFIKQSVKNTELKMPDDEFARVDAAQGSRDNQATFFSLKPLRFFHTVVPLSVTEFYEAIGVTRTVRSDPDYSHEWIRPLLSVKWLIDSNNKDSVDMEGFEKVGEQNGFTIWENKNFIPMGFTYDNYISSKTFYDTSKNYRERLMLKGIILNDRQIEKYKDILTEAVDYNIYSSEDLTSYCEERRKVTVKDFKYDSLGFTCNIDLEKPNLVFFSVPYEEGWSAYVNGKKVDIEKVNVGLMAVYCDAGHSDIEFKYMTPGLIEGLTITGLTVILIILYILIIRLTKKKKTVLTYTESLETEAGADTVSE